MYHIVEQSVYHLLHVLSPFILVTYTVYWNLHRSTSVYSRTASGLVETGEERVEAEAVPVFTQVNPSKGPCHGDDILAQDRQLVLHVSEPLSNS